ncbi:MAG: type II toxin-antitoxin system RelE/ParE family toxin [Gammaproteobacteria bacterium]
MSELIIKTTPEFDRKAHKLMTPEALEELFDYLLLSPEQGKIISGTSGIRKLRWKTGKNDRGKSGGARVLYHYSKGLLIILVSLYDKTEKENISPAERNAFKRLVPVMVEKYKGEL